MDISAISNSLVQQIGHSATQTGDAVAIRVLRQAMDLQSSQAAQLIDSVAKAAPDPSQRLGVHIDVRV